jgi:hypothetical protein
MGVGLIFPNNLRASLFNDDLSNEPNFGRIHLAIIPLNQWGSETLRLWSVGRKRTAEEEEEEGDGKQTKNADPKP